MNGPATFPSRALAADTVLLGAYLPVPGFGVLPVNAFVVRAREPVLVDTGLAALRGEFLRALGEAMDPVDLRWIWLTHADLDHMGNLEAVLRAAPQARVVTNFLGMAKLGLHGLPAERVRLVNPGQHLDVGDRKLVALAPPCFDAPETMAVFDPATRTLFSSDCFGALLEEPAETARDVAPEALRDGVTTWATVDAPWLHMVREDRFVSALAGVAQLSPDRILGSHLPPAESMTHVLLEHLERARAAPAFVGPDHAQLERMMAAAPAA